MLKITKANIYEINDVIQHYKTIINQIKDYSYSPGWKYGIYPTDEHITNAIKKGELYVGKLDSKIVASLIINKNPVEANEKIIWTQKLNVHEIYYIHLVAVNQNYKKRGLAKQMLYHSFNLAKNNLIKSIRLSLNVKNITIENLYLKTGFKLKGTEKVFIKKRGYITFNFYEKIV